MGILEKPQQCNSGKNPELLNCYDILIEDEFSDTTLDVSGLKTGHGRS